MSIVAAFFLVYRVSKKSTICTLLGHLFTKGICLFARLKDVNRLVKTRFIMFFQPFHGLIPINGLVGAVAPSNGLSNTSINSIHLIIHQINSL